MLKSTETRISTDTQCTLHITAPIADTKPLTSHSAREARANEVPKVCSVLVGDVDNGIHRTGVHHPERWLPLHLQIRRTHTHAYTCNTQWHIANNAYL